MSEKISNLSCVYVNSEIDTYDKFKTMFMNFDNDEYLIHLPVKYKHMIYSINKLIETISSDYLEDRTSHVNKNILNHILLLLSEKLKTLTYDELTKYIDDFLDGPHLSISKNILHRIYFLEPMDYLFEKNVKQNVSEEVINKCNALDIFFTTNGLFVSNKDNKIINDVSLYDKY